MTTVLTEAKDTIQMKYENKNHVWAAVAVVLWHVSRYNITTLGARSKD